jgi:hypothetical protein
VSGIDDLPDVTPYAQRLLRGHMLAVQRHASYCTRVPPCSSAAIMRETHGTPRQFMRAAYAACGEIALIEAARASQAYAEEYEAAI